MTYREAIDILHPDRCDDTLMEFMQDHYAEHGTYADVCGLWQKKRDEALRKACDALSHCLLMEDDGK